MPDTSHTTQGKLGDWRQAMQGFHTGGVIAVLVFFGILLLGWYVMRVGRIQTPRIVQEVQHRVQNREGSEALSKQLQSLTQPETEVIPVIPQVAYAAQGLRDPFVGPLHLKAWAEARQRAKAAPRVEEPPQPPPQLMVQGVILGQATPYAIINNAAVELGDTVAGAHVVRIDSEGIVVNFQGKELRYRVQQTQGAADNQMSEPQHPLPPTPSMEHTHFGVGRPAPGGETRRSSW